jgi:hypothetical protein
MSMEGKSPQLRRGKKLPDGFLASLGRFDPFLLPEGDRAYAAVWFQAINDYEQHVPVADIELKYGVRRSGLYQKLERLQKPDFPGGPPLGWSCLRKYRHCLASERKCHLTLADLQSARPKAGAINALFKYVPELQPIAYDIAVHGKVPGSKQGTPLLSWQDKTEAFRSACTAEGVQPGTFPFVAQGNCGAVAFVRWGKKQLREALRQAQFKEAKRLSQDPWSNPNPRKARYFRQVQFDGHKVDISWWVDIPSLTGSGYLRLRVDRLWIIALREVDSKAVLGYSIAFGENYNASDVFSAVQNALRPWEPLDLPFPLRYGNGDCMPSAAHPLLAWMRWDELHWDNYPSHLSEVAQHFLMRVAGCTIVYGGVDSPNSRALIEELFHLIEEAGIHKFDGNLGKNPRDTNRDYREDNRFVIKYEILAAIIDLLLCRVNNTRSPGTSQTCNELLVSAVTQSAQVFRHVPERLREEYCKYDMFEEATISRTRGETTPSRPVINWRDARYGANSEALLSRPGLVGQQVLIKANSRDSRWIEVWLTKDGTSLGEVQIERRYRPTPQNVFARRYDAARARSEGYFHNVSDIVIAGRIACELDRRTRANSRKLVQHHLDGKNPPPASAMNAAPAETDTAPQPSAAALAEGSPKIEAVLEEKRRMGSVYR